ncbi:hypothetical protein BG006_005228 [Podila minutissima]|uniref:F-box domain-containing protein n=1 Tax=Podila minutissima TaxID=64525 RepID=A0A9P5SL44_9FUNG|nr:hypothetical protein BG006_005228 [Podila minutissima]
MSVVLRPVEIPEIIYQIGLRVPIWLPSPTGHGCKSFKPSDLVSCLKVCRNWNSALTPILWMVYDDTQMVCDDHPVLYVWPKQDPWSIPVEILHKHSWRFRHVSIWTPWPQGALQSTRLQSLCLGGEAIYTNTDILLSNRQLRDLKLAFRNKANLIQIRPVLESVTWLESVTFDQLTLTDRHGLVGFLNNSTSLKSLAFEYPQGISGIGTCVPQTELRTLRFRGEWGRNPGMAQIVLLCPRLESFDLSIPGCPFEELAPYIRDNCPHLSTLKCEGFVKNAYHYELLLLACTRLARVFTPLVQSLASISSGLLRHLGWLEYLDLDLQGNAKENAVSLCKILSGECSSLKKLVVHQRLQSRGAPHQVPSDDWFDLPWQCPVLESVYLYGYVQPCVVFRRYFDDGVGPREIYRVEKDYALLSTADRAFLDDIANHGWVLKKFAVAGASESATFSESEMSFWDQIFVCVKGSPCLRTVASETCVFSSTQALEG